jgi:hypothetical protein
MRSRTMTEAITRARILFLPLSESTLKPHIVPHHATAEA